VDLDAPHYQAAPQHNQQICVEVFALFILDITVRLDEFDPDAMIFAERIDGVFKPASTATVLLLSDSERREPPQRWRHAERRASNTAWKSGWPRMP
jgi:hypothetical protein